MQGPPNLWPDRPETHKKVNQVLDVIVQNYAEPPPQLLFSVVSFNVSLPLQKNFMRYNSSIYLYFICKEGEMNI